MFDVIFFIEVFACISRRSNPLTAFFCLRLWYHVFFQTPILHTYGTSNQYHTKEFFSQLLPKSYHPILTFIMQFLPWHMQSQMQFTNRHSRLGATVAVATVASTTRDLASLNQNSWNIPFNFRRASGQGCLFTKSMLPMPNSHQRWPETLQY